ncbi:MAG: 2-C-methyl-D-erythritol 2,4-cyclodiphosphate synthase [Peptococcaceae bacterium]|jgi:2-C-methyl-D-erythritol 2,4-cyclodiphosphate synthase|nr:2-C-methyl-D-erythritol 2,4-cyclodiphosphate synthase [Peptococcaceae bacterium]
MRVGMGYDAHRLVAGDHLVLGGVEIPFEKKLLAHSDGDVLLHAIADSLLGAAGLGDIGVHFPDNDPAYRGISSLVLLERVGEKLTEAGLAVQNVDSTIVAQQPKLVSFIPQMRENIAAALGLDSAMVNVKATTTEGMGFTGSGEGIAAYAVCLLVGKWH